MIELAPWPNGVKKVRDEETGEEVEILEFPDNGSPEAARLKTQEPVKPDVIIFATGYRREFPFLSDEDPSLKDCKVRGVYNNIEDGFAYIGFIRPAIGKSFLLFSRFPTH